MVNNHTAIRVCRELIEDLDCNCFMSCSSGLDTLAVTNLLNVSSTITNWER